MGATGWVDAPAMEAMPTPEAIAQDASTAENPDRLITLFFLERYMRASFRTGLEEYRDEDIMSNQCENPL